ncbi:MAG TPA: lysylphosphatidylglycerol synthase transmembrane domain-containing protein [Solirubrobacteraceae bacterium]|nr:lysylphosphatidylglycerol synthase transmembrane domain-containing protein [Solirubrobacteraceae bacterium]
MSAAGANEPVIQDGAEQLLAVPGHRARALHRMRTALSATRGRLAKSAVKLLGYAVLAFLLLKLIPGLKQALASLQHVSWAWVLGAILLETISELGFVTSWRTILDPENLLGRDDRGPRMSARVAWTQLGGSTLMPGGSLASMGVGGWILHRLGMPTKRIAEREFNLSFLNTAIDALALVGFGLALATGLFSGKRELTLTLVPAILALLGIVVVRLLALRSSARPRMAEAKHPKLAAALTTVIDAVNDTGRLLFHRAGLKSVLGALVYLWFDVLVLWTAFFAVHADPVPGFAVVVMAYIIGALGGSIPLPAGLGAVGGIVGMLILYGVGHNAAFAAVVIYQAVGLLVPLVGGGIAYVLLRRSMAQLQGDEVEGSLYA